MEIVDNIYVYTLQDPRTPGLVRYVGQTNNPRARLNSHIYEANNSAETTANARFRWLKELAALGLKPEMKVIEVVPLDRGGESEKAWLAFYRQVGMPMVNTASASPTPREARARYEKMGRIIHLG